MPTSKQKNKPKLPKKIALLAGAGMLPRMIYESCQKKDIECLIIGVEGHISTELYEGIEYSSLPIYSLSSIVKTIHDRKIKNIVLAGKVNRTGISRLLLDAKGIKLFTTIIRNGMSDNAILTSVIKFFESEGFTILSSETIADDLIMPLGNLTKHININANAKKDIKQGLQILRGISAYDVGQSLVIQNSLVLGVEAAEGTDQLIKRCMNIAQESGDRPVLIKICKPTQDTRVDLPCIGPNTIIEMHKSGIQGIAIEAGKALILEKQKTIEEAEKLGVFVYGI